jgi:Type II secretion system (T2SS), protein M
MTERLQDLLHVLGDAIATLINALASSRPVRALAALIGRAFNPIARRLAPAFSAGRVWYQKREARERLLIKVAGTIGAIFVVYNLIYVPLVDLRQDMQDRVEARQRELVHVRALMRSYDRVRADLSEAEKGTVPDKDFSLFSVIEQSLDRSVGRTKIGSITPSDRPLPGGFQQHVVDLKLTGLSLPQIVDTLYGVQSLPVPVTVSNLHIRQLSQDSYSYDVDMTCMALGRS